MDFYRRVTVSERGRPHRWSRRSFGMERDGLWGMRYPTGGTGFMFDKGETGWALSGAVAGRGLLVGWQKKMQIVLDVHAAEG